MINSKLIKKEIAPGFFGVFAKEKIKKDEVVFSGWNDTCTRKTRAEVEAMSPEYKLIFEKYSTEIIENVYVGPYENEDIHQQIDYFINHSCDPSTWMINDNDVVARRDIEPGEQLTIDYATFIINEFDSSGIDKCLCGAAKCRGKVSKNDWWKMRNEYRGHYLSWIQAKITKREEERNQGLYSKAS